MTKGSKKSVKAGNQWTVARYLSDKKPEPVRLFRIFEKMVKACGPCKTEAHKSIVYWKDQRVFAGAFIASQRLEIVIDPRRRVAHPSLRVAWKTTVKVVTHRLKIERAEELDESISRLLCEALATVGPGTRD
jgi:hypothetical protein